MSDINFSRIQALVDRPNESLAVELKRWIDPDQPEGKAKIVKTALALRNYGGGYLIIGFDDNTHEPDQGNMPQDVKAAFHTDNIQALISRYASEPFEVSVEFPERGGQPYPVLIVPPGVRTPVAAKADLWSADGATALISIHDVYMRSLSSNNTPSTTKATWKDWPSILEICFDNREADIGRFLRRHFGGMSPEVVHEFLGSIASGLQPEVTTEDRLKGYLQKSAERYSTVVEERRVQLPSHGAWEVGLLLIGDIPQHHSANEAFLNLLNANNPHYNTSWPIWQDSRIFPDEYKPYPFENAWEALIVTLDPPLPYIDFMRLGPKGRFYFRQALYEDMRDLEPMKYLDSTLPIRKTAEAIAVGIAFAKAMGCDPEETQLAFGFRWTKLKGRELISWEKQTHYLRPIGPAYQDEVSAFVEVPLETPLSALGEYVHQAIQPLFQIFNGFELGKNVVEDLAYKTIRVR